MKYCGAVGARRGARQRELGIAETFEWVAETTPSLAAAARAAGLAVSEHPLLVLVDDGQPLPASLEGIEVRLTTEADDLSLLNAIACVAFGAPASAAGPEGLEATRAVLERDAAALAAQIER